MLQLIWNIFNLILNIVACIWLACSLLFGCKWQVGNFMSIKIYPILYKSKQRYKEDTAHGKDN